MHSLYTGLTFCLTYKWSRTIEQLQAENQRLQGFLEEPSDAPNQNGKRRMLDSHRYIS